MAAADRAVLRRLDRIDALDGAGAPARCLIDELRALAAEATAWVEDGPAAWGGVEVVAGARPSGDPAAADRAARQAAARAVTRLRATLEGELPRM